MFLLFVLIFAFAEMMEGVGQPGESVEKTKAVGATGCGCCVVVWIALLIYGLLRS